MIISHIYESTLGPLKKQIITRSRDYFTRYRDYFTRFRNYCKCLSQDKLLRDLVKYIRATQKNKIITRSRDYFMKSCDNFTKSRFISRDLVFISRDIVIMYLDSNTCNNYKIS